MRKFALPFIAFCTASSPQVLLAQSGNGLTLEEIIITAQKREQSLQDAPVSVSAFDAGMIEKMGVLEPGDISNYVPNVQISKQTGSTDNYSYAIRGAAAGETALLNEQTVGLYIDGMYVARNTGAAIDVADIERMEVLRGPQGSLYGRNTIGGAINIITAKPSEEFGFKQDFTFGARDRFTSRTVVDTGKLNDVFSAKVSYLHSEHDGFVRNTINDQRIGDKDADAFRLALRFDFSESTTLDYSYANTKSEGLGNLAQITFVRPGHVASGGTAFAQAAAMADANRRGELTQAFAEPEKTEVESHGLTLTWSGENAEFKSVTSYREWDSSAPSIDFGSIVSDGATVLDVLTGGMPIPAGTMVPLFQAGRTSTSEQLTQELQIVGSIFDNKLNYVAGLYYFKEEVDEDNPQQFLLPTPFVFGGAGVGTSILIPAPIFVYGATTESVAIYGQAEWSFNEALSATFGWRYTKDDKEAFIRNGNFMDGLPSDGGAADVRDSNDWTKFNPSLTLTYQINDDVTTYLRAATGYRSGGYNARVSAAAQFSDPFDEETALSIELGLKSTWFDQRVRLNASIFQVTYEDQQISQFAAGSGGASSIIVNAGESETFGAELELTAILTEGLQLSLNYGFMDAEFNEYIGGPVDQITGVVNPALLDPADPNFPNRDLAPLGLAQVPQTPENSASIILDYQFPEASFGTVNLRLDATYTDGFNFNPVLFLPENAAEDQHTVNARLGISNMPVGGDGEFRIAVWGKNITNEEDKGFGIDFGALGYTVNSFNELASWGIDFTYEY